jgi:hypothetical protein
MKPCRGHHHFLPALLLAAALFVPIVARSGAIAPCEHPMVFDRAAVNAVILPYRYTGDKRHQMLSEAGQQLSRLLQLETLFALVKYGSVGAVELQGEPGGCQVDRILDQLTQGSGQGRLRPGHGLILLWGRIYEEGSDIYLQSYLKFLRGQTAEEFRFPLGAGEEFLARLPAQGFAFPPRRLSQEDLKQITTRFADSAVIRAQPDLNASGESLAAWPAWKPFAYWVTEVRRDWMHIQAQDQSGSGWVRARLDPKAWPLRQKLPELTLLDALAGYLRFQVGKDVAEVKPAPEAALGQMRETLALYLSQTEGQSEALPQAVGLAAEGIVRLCSGGEGAVQQAAAQFTRARNLVPQNAEARNLAVLGQWLLERQGSEVSGGSLVQGLLDAVAVAPSNPQTLANLETLYRQFQLTPAQSPFPEAELAKRLTTLRQIRAAQQPPP